jgi:hypothetical protein
MKDKIIKDGIEYYKVIGNCKNCSLYNEFSYMFNSCYYNYRCSGDFCYKKKSDLRKEKIENILK